MDSRTLLQRKAQGIVDAIPDPELGLSLGELGMVEAVDVTNDQIKVVIALTTPGCPLKNQIRTILLDALSTTDGIGERDVVIAFTELSREAKERALQLARRGAQDRAQTPPSLAGTQLLAFASGKGGVGKSSIATAVAQNIARRGYRVGLLDADIWGFSQPHLLDAGDERLQADGDPEKFSIRPYERTIGAGAVAVVSMGMLVEEAESAIMWRGLMLSRALQHFIEDVDWANPDYLIVDLPPGTGDVSMTLARLLPATKVALVTTPSPLASHVAERAASFALKANLGLLGVIENMSYLECPHATKLTPFGSGGGSMIATKYSLPLLGSIPIAEELGDLEDLVTLTSHILEELGRWNEDLLGCTAHLWDAVTSQS